MTATLGFSRPFTSPFSTGTSAQALVPGKFDVSIDGRGYMLDRKMLASGDVSLISSIRATRTQSDGSTEPGEQSLTPDDLWRRTQQSWHLGAGQDYLDREDSDRRQFRASIGIDPWTKGQLSLLNATTSTLSAAGTNLALMPAGSRLYAVDGTALKYTTDLVNWSTVTGTSGVAITGIASDGFYVWVTDGADVYRTDTGSTAAASWSTIDCDILGYVKGRLMHADGPQLAYFSALGTPAETELFVHANTNFTWVGFAEGQNHIYAAGFVGDKSLIYRISIVAEGTLLGAPTVAGTLPDGEIIYSIGSYLGFIFLGTSEGARFCTSDTNGNLTIGELIPTDNPVRCFEGQGGFVWYGITNYDGTNGGLGRMSLRFFSDISALKPAYATDLMTAQTADIQSVATFLGVRVFAVSGVGYFKEDTANLVATGTMDCGWLNFGITEQKIPAYLDATFLDGFGGSTTAYYAINGGSTYVSVGAHNTETEGETAHTFLLTESGVDQVEIRYVFARDTSPTTSGPVLIRHTVRAQPIPLLRRKITLPVVLHEKVETNAKTWAYYDPSEELSVIEGWRITKQVVSLVVGSESYSAVMDDFDYLAINQTTKRGFWQGTGLLHWKTV